MNKKKIINRYWLLLAVETAVMLLITIMYKHHSLVVLFALCLCSLVLITIETCFELKILRVASIVCGTLASVSGLLWFIPGMSESYLYITLLISCICFSIFFLIAVIAVGKHVFTSNHVTSNIIVGSVSIYLLIGICFTFIYTVLVLTNEGEFYVSGAPMVLGVTLGNVGMKEFLYFSFSTLTTTGFGDVVPKDPLTRMASYFESIIGSLYLAIVVAKLVGMSVTQKMQKHGDIL